MIEERVRAKLQDLVSRAPALGGALRDGRQASQCYGWITEALNAVELAVPLPTNAYRREVTEKANDDRFFVSDKVSRIAEMLSALIRDMEAGLIGDFGNKIRAETFDDFLDHAEAYRAEGRKMEAGVIAGVVFEDTVRRIYRDKVGDDRDRSLEDLINGLARHQVITGQQSKQAKVGSHVRTKATHAQWDEFDMLA